MKNRGNQGDQPVWIVLCVFSIRGFVMRSVVQLLLIMVVCWVGGGTAQARELVLVLLPQEQPETVIASGRPLAALLAGRLQQPVQIRYFSSYQDILQQFKRGTIDILHLGPLPYLTLRQMQAGAEPLVVVNEADGTAAYSCALVTAYDGPTVLAQLQGPLALPQPLSTCGHLTASYLLDRQGKNLEKLGYSYLGNHDKVALAVARGGYQAGTMKTALAAAYAGLGLRVLAETPRFPGFLLVANRANLSPQRINELRKVLLGLTEQERATLQLGKYGFSRVTEAQYEQLQPYQLRQR